MSAGGKLSLVGYAGKVARGVVGLEGAPARNFLPLHITWWGASSPREYRASRKSCPASPDTLEISYSGIMRSRHNNSRTVLYVLVALTVGYLGFRTFRGSSNSISSTKSEATQKVHEKKRDAFSMSDPKSLVEAAVQDNPVMVFSKSYCPYCK
jgi:hypothetical protein